jgi:hypothetical protein
MDNHIFELAVGLMLAIAGLISILRRRFSLGLGGGKSGLARSLFTIMLTDARATGFGIISLVGAAIALLPLLRVYITNDTTAANNGILTLALVLGAIIAISGFGIECLFELQHKTKEDAEQETSDEEIETDL